MSETFADKVKALNLPLDQIIVIGSGILDQLGIVQLVILILRRVLI